MVDPTYGGLLPWPTNWPPRARLEKVKRLLDACESAAGRPGEQVQSMETMEKYVAATGQLKYVHQRLPTRMTIWRDLRRRFGGEQVGPVVSLGSGPCHCLLGWFWDKKPEKDQEVLAFDALPWEAVRGHQAWSELVDDVIGVGTLSYESGVFVPPDRQSSQVIRTANKARGLDAKEVPSNSTVLLSYVLNHFTEPRQEIGDQRELWAWLNALRDRGARVLLVDFFYDPEFPLTSALWSEVRDGLGIQGMPPEVSLEPQELTPFGWCYSEDFEEFRTGSNASRYGVYSGVMGGQDGWSWIPWIPRRK